MANFFRLSAAAIIERSESRLAAIPHLHVSPLALSVLIGPVAEEYLFRGLLYRSLNREWAGWQAAMGSTAFSPSHPFLGLATRRDAWLIQRGAVQENRA